MTRLWQLSAHEQAIGIAKGDFSSSELVEAHLSRIDAINPTVNAIVTVLADRAASAAKAADRAIAAKEPVGRLHGIPFTVKANIDMAGLPTTWGVTALADAIVEEDAPVVERMIAEGAIPIGRTNLPDMALRVTTQSTLYGGTRNPWNGERTCGGSSGGEAVSLATGMSAIGLGNDIGGSLRSPANACGIVSIRPSAGLVPDAGNVPSPDRLLVGQIFNVQGPMARTVADVRLALSVLRGRHPRDPWSLEVAPTVDLQLAGTKIAMIAAPPGASVDPVVSATVRAAADSLSAAGCDIVEITPPQYQEAEEAWFQILLKDYASVIDHLLPIMGEDGQNFFTNFSKSCFRDADLSLSHFLALRDGIAREWSVFADTYPLILSPVWNALPFVERFDVERPENAPVVREMISPMMPANLLGLPSACVPAGYDELTGLPIGVLLTGGRFSDDLCLAAAEVVERGANVTTPIDPR